MTPEERFNKLEITVDTLAQLVIETKAMTEVKMREAQANADFKIDALANAQIRTEEALARLSEAQAKTEEAQAYADAKIAELAEAQKRTDAALERLAESEANLDRKFSEWIDFNRGRRGDEA
ncbi:MAG: hypothetical protein ICV60_01525 [Pyrinomonadaceae bacterium]|nr:hypothetical protein [Pyrinomonadaceae bacterium]